MFSLFDVDAVYLCGGFNSLDNYISDVDNIPTRIHLDSTVNNYGDILIEFLRDVKCCVLNEYIWA